MIDRSTRVPSLKRVLSLAVPHWKILAIATLVAILSAAVTLSIPRTAGWIIDAALVDRDSAQLDRVVWTLIGIFVLYGVLVFADSYLLRSAGAHLLTRLRDQLFGHLMTLGPGFYSQRRVGELLSRIGADLEKIQQIITQVIPSGVRAGLLLAGTVAVAFSMHQELALVTLASLAPAPLVTIWVGKKLRPLSTDLQDSVAESAAVGHDALVGVRTVQAFGQERHQQGRYRQLLETVLATQLRFASVSGRLAGVLAFLGLVSFALVLWYGGRLILRDELTVGELTAFLLYMFAIAGSIGLLGQLYGGVRQLRGSSVQLFEILDTRALVQDRPRAEPLGEPRGDLRFANVGYQYANANGRWALRNVEMQISKGETVAIVGPSGAGKSTLFSLILRFFDPTEGVIQVDGTDLRNWSLAALRRSIAIVPQEIDLFTGSVADNIRVGKANATDEQVREAAIAVGADPFIQNLPRGYQERLGDRGANLSAGQRQRLALARVFLRKPVVLLLDEATSALDADAESGVTAAIGHLMRGGTTLIIAHRLATACKADRIMLLESGRIVGAGHHKQLFSNSQLYRRYWALQSGAPLEST